MIRAKGTNKQSGAAFVILGVSRKNVKRLVDEGMPIRVTGESINLPTIDSIVIYFAETDTQLVRKLHEFGVMDSATAVRLDARPPEVPS